MKTINSRINLLGIPVDAYTMDQTIHLIDQNISGNILTHHGVVNAAKVVYAQKDMELKASIVDCDIINADGQAIVWAARLLKKYLPERVAGIDLMEALVKLSAKKNYSIFFLGAKEEVVKKVVKTYTECYGKQIIAGYHNGYFSKEEESEVAKQISESGANILFVAMSSPQKEIFLNTYKNLINVSFIMGVGGSFDVVAGVVKRAPKWMQKTGLEWFFRITQEPQRMWKRYLTTNSTFIYLILKEKFSAK